MLLLTLISPLLAADKAEEDQSRGPYEFQFRVDDPETFNKYEVGVQAVSLKSSSKLCCKIQEAGDPNIVTGSYRINLPDGRTQVVSYEVRIEER